MVSLCTHSHSRTRWQGHGTRLASQQPPRTQVRAPDAPPGQSLGSTRDMSHSRRGTLVRHRHLGESVGSPTAAAGRGQPHRLGPAGPGAGGRAGLTGSGGSPWPRPRRQRRRPGTGTGDNGYGGPRLRMLSPKPAPATAPAPGPSPTSFSGTAPWSVGSVTGPRYSRLRAGGRRGRAAPGRVSAGLAYPAPLHFTSHSAAAAVHTYHRNAGGGTAAAATARRTSTKQFDDSSRAVAEAARRTAYSRLASEAFTSRTLRCGPGLRAGWGRWGRWGWAWLRGCVACCSRSACFAPSPSFH